MKPFRTKTRGSLLEGFSGLYVRGRVIVTAMLFMLLNLSVLVVNAQVEVGDVLCERKIDGEECVLRPSAFNLSDYKALGVVFRVDHSGQHGWVVDLEKSAIMKWCGTFIEVDATTVGDPYSVVLETDGYLFTKSLLEAAKIAGLNDMFAAQRGARDAIYDENGRFVVMGKWYLPAVGQLTYLYSQIVRVEATLDLLKSQGVAVSKLTDGFELWSSNQRSPFVWSVGMSGGVASGQHDMAAGAVRSVRNF